MNEYKFQIRKKKRGDNCCFAATDQNGKPISVLCGCGCRIPPSKKHKNRIIRRTLQRNFVKELNQEEN